MRVVPSTYSKEFGFFAVDYRNIWFMCFGKTCILIFSREILFVQPPAGYVFCIMLACIYSMVFVYVVEVILIYHYNFGASLKQQKKYKITTNTKHEQNKRNTQHETQTNKKQHLRKQKQQLTRKHKQTNTHII
jgi:mannitol-specific phosphotransferase system IIBC component